MILQITHPEIAFRDCASCQAFFYDDSGKIVLYDGKPYPRGKVPTPCKTSAGCPKGSPDAGIALSDKNRQALAFHRRCKAVGRWPDDPIVTRNAAVIESAEAEGEIIRERERVRRERENNR